MGAVSKDMENHKTSIRICLQAMWLTAWVKRLPRVSALNSGVMRLTGKKPTNALKEKAVAAKLPLLI